MPDSPKIEPCPFCGGENVESWSACGKDEDFIHCNDCKASGPKGLTLEGAILSWNATSIMIKNWMQHGTLDNNADNRKLSDIEDHPSVKLMRETMAIWYYRYEELKRRVKTGDPEQCFEYVECIESVDGPQLSDLFFGSVAGAEWKRSPAGYRYRYNKEGDCLFKNPTPEGEAVSVLSELEAYISNIKNQSFEEWSRDSINGYITAVTSIESKLFELKGEDYKFRERWKGVDAVFGGEGDAVADIVTPKLDADGKPLGLDEDEGEKKI